MGQWPRRVAFREGGYGVWWAAGNAGVAGNGEWRVGGGDGGYREWMWGFEDV